MKDKYIKPETEFETFRTSDIVTTSGEPDTDVEWGT